MGRTRNNLELGLAFHERHCIAIHLKNRRVLATNNEQRWSADKGCGRARQIWAASSRHHSLYRFLPLRSRHKRSRRTRTCAEQPNPAPVASD
jgi:hypothetical protein